MSDRPITASGDTRFVPPSSAAPTPGDGEALDGWGYADTRFVVKPNGVTVLTGQRYNISNVELPTLMPWFAERLEAPLGPGQPQRAALPPGDPRGPLGARAARRAAHVPRAGAADRRPEGAPASRARPHRRRDLGHPLPHARAGARPGGLPHGHDEVVRLVETARKHEACVIPFGGGTNVTEALRLSVDEQRFVIAVDMRRMNRVLWVDAVNHMACIEAGATGQHIVDELEEARPDDGPRARQPRVLHAGRLDRHQRQRHEEEPLREHRGARARHAGGHGARRDGAPGAGRAARERGREPQAVHLRQRGQLRHRDHGRGEALRGPRGAALRQRGLPEPRGGARVHVRPASLGRAPCQRARDGQHPVPLRPGAQAGQEGPLGQDHGEPSRSSW
jgi:hypothetical protein